MSRTQLWEARELYNILKEVERQGLCLVDVGSPLFIRNARILRERMVLNGGEWGDRLFCSSLV
ncbi:hypothetical protein [Sunxiuqinia sp. sy24]|uniref:hypothetical protein n=1 Tax=Sunxiuqinia sp. sy24 TaxID=3461495 RepID=UPI0040453BB3